MTNVAPRGVPSLPWISEFPELNVRTYVRVDGKPGVYFFSLDAGSTLAVQAARSLLNLPYYPAAMSVSSNVDEIRYDSRRRHGGDAPATWACAIGLSDLRVRQSAEVSILPHRTLLLIQPEPSACAVPARDSPSRMAAAARRGGVHAQYHGRRCRRVVTGHEPDPSLLEAPGRRRMGTVSALSEHWPCGAFSTRIHPTRSAHRKRLKRDVRGWRRGTIKELLE